MKMPIGRHRKTDCNYLWIRLKTNFTYNNYLKIKQYKLNWIYLSECTALPLVVGSKLALFVHVKRSIFGANYPMTGQASVEQLNNQKLHPVWRNRPKAIQYRDNPYSIMIINCTRYGNSGKC